MKHELISSNLAFLLLAIILNCVFIKEIFSQDLSSPYLGQTAPGLKAVRFSPGGIQQMMIGSGTVRFHSHRTVLNYI